MGMTHEVEPPNWTGSEPHLKKKVKYYLSTKLKYNSKKESLEKQR